MMMAGWRSCIGRWIRQRATASSNSQKKLHRAVRRHSHLELSAYDHCNSASNSGP